MGMIGHMASQHRHAFKFLLLLYSLCLCPVKIENLPHVIEITSSLSFQPYFEVLCSANDIVAYIREIPSIVR